MKPIGVDVFFKIKVFNDEFDSTLNVNYKTDEPVFSENIAEEASSNTDIMGEEESGNLENITKQPDKVNQEIEEPVDAEAIFEESSANPQNIDAE